MGTLVVTEFVSVDGVFEDPGGAEDYEHGGWTFEYDRGDEGNEFKLAELMEAEVQLLGRKTYEGFAAAWPSREGPFADKLNADPKVVVSTTLERPGVAEHDGDLGRRPRGDREAEGGDRTASILVAGSGTLVATLLEANLVDELRLMVFPTILGRGRRLFPDGIDRLKLDARRDADGRPGRRPGPDLPAGRVSLAAATLPRCPPARTSATSPSSRTSTTARRRSSTPCSGSPVRSGPTRTWPSASWTRWISSARRGSRSSPRTPPSGTAGSRSTSSTRRGTRTSAARSSAASRWSTACSCSSTRARGRCRRPASCCGRRSRRGCR